ncbi:MAG: HD domain-containing protein [Oscillospiraceae bacterium]|nr:HD domain-containing protein [Oscillospiraceae bacterium]
MAGIFALIHGEEQNASSVRLTLTSIGCMVMNSGAFLMALVKTEAEARIVLKFQHLGNALFYYFFISFLITYLRLHASKLLLYLWGVFEVAVVAIQWSETITEALLGHVYFTRNETLQIWTVHQETSALLTARNTGLLLILACGCIYTLIQLMMSKIKSERRNLFKLACGEVVMIVALILKLYANLQIELTPMLTSLSLVAIVISILANDFFGVTDSGHEWIFAQMENPYIITDREYGYLDANAPAKKLFPELAKMRIHERISDGLYTVFHSHTTYFELGEGAYERKLTTIEKKGEIVGYGLLLDDETKQQQYVKLLNEYNSRLQNEVEQKTDHIRKVQDSILTGMASVIESRDNSTGGHINRTSRVVHIFAQKLLMQPDMPKSLGLSKSFLRYVIKSAPMHDLGKISVDDEILRKPGKFTEAEYAEMQKHAPEGARILKNVLNEVDNEEFVQIAVNIANFHHERWDGTGYPEHRKGEAIPPEARIMALADVFDALVSKRCYKEAYSYEHAFSIIKESLGTQFDPILGKVFLECRNELEAYYSSLS